MTNYHMTIMSDNDAAIERLNKGQYKIEYASLKNVTVEAETQEQAIKKVICQYSGYTILWNTIKADKEIAEEA